MRRHRPPAAARGDKDFDVTHKLAGCLEMLANALAARSLFNDSIKAYQESIALRRDLLAADPATPSGSASLAIS